jgi:hypothetical protein
MFSRSLRRADHVRVYSVSASGAGGWEVRLEENRSVRRLEYHRDWHRVERALAMIDQEISELVNAGWSIAPLPAPVANR